LRNRHTKSYWYELPLARGRCGAFAWRNLFGYKVDAREWLEKAVASSEEIMDPEVEESERMLEGL